MPALFIVLSSLSYISLSDVFTIHPRLAHSLILACSSLHGYLLTCEVGFEILMQGRETVNDVGGL